MRPSASVLKAKEYFSRKAAVVYLEDEFNLPRRRTFRTGVPVFIGLVKNRPREIAQQTSKKARLAEQRRHGPQMLSLWSQFSVHVGEPDQDCTLAYAVRGFFENGGERCYVLVLADESPESLWK